jgi:hypothetical protein
MKIAVRTELNKKKTKQAPRKNKKKQKKTSS